MWQPGLAVASARVEAVSLWTGCLRRIPRPVSFDAQRREGEESRLRAAAERSAARRTAPPVPASRSTDALSGLALHGAIGSVFLGVGLVLGLTLWPLGGVVLGAAGLGVGLRGVVQAARSGTSDPARASLPTGDPRAQAAYEAACEAIDSSRALDEPQRLELLAALRGGYEALSRQDSERPRLEAALRVLPEDGGGEAGEGLHRALDLLQSRREDFVAHCARLQATLATLALRGAGGEAVDELALVVGGFVDRSAADAELEEALRDGARTASLVGAAE